MDYVALFELFLGKKKIKIINLVGDELGYKHDFKQYLLKSSNNNLKSAKNAILNLNLRKSPLKSSSHRVCDNDVTI